MTTARPGIDSRLGHGGFMLNRDSETEALLDFPDDVFLVDSTIRSLQSTVSGSSHRAQDLVDIGMKVDELGVRELLVNAQWADGIETIEGLAARRPKAKIVATFRVQHPDAKDFLRASIEAGADEVCLESPEDTNVLEAAAKTAQEQGLTISVAFAERHTWEEMIELAKVGMSLDAKSLSFHDSFFRFGITPEAMGVFIRRVRSSLPGHPPLYIHLSNFYGTSTMLAVKAIASGANAADVCLNATGHHCGHLSLGEVTMILEDLYDVRTGIALDRIDDAVDFITERTGVPIKAQQPVIGELAFMVDGADWAAEAHLPYDDRMHSRVPFEPQIVGSTETMVWTTRTASPWTMEVKLRSLGLPAAESDGKRAFALLSEAVKAVKAYPYLITDEQLTDILQADFS